MGIMITEYAKVYKMLEDAESRDIYIHRLNYLITGEYRYVHEIVTAYLPDLWPLDGRTMDDLRASLPQDKKIVLYGAGKYGKIILPYWKQDERFLGFCSHTKKKQEEGYLGYPCISPEELLRRKDLTVIITAVWDRDEIRQVLKDGGYPDSLVFDTRGIEKEDSLGQYFTPEFMNYGKEEVFIDAGCLDLSSSLKFREHCGAGHVKKVYAFEPDPKSYERCLKKKEETAFQEAEILPLVLYPSRN